MKLFLRFFIILFLPIAVINALSNRAYITNFNDDFITVIDLNTNEKIADIKTGKNPHGVDVSPDGKFVAVSNEGDNKIVAIDIAKMEVTSEINVFGFPRVPVITNDGRTIYSTLRWLDGVLKIDTEKNRVVDWIQLSQSESFPQEGKASHGPGIHQDGKYLYLTSQILNSVSVIEIETQSIVKEIAVGKDPNWIDFTKDGKTAVVSNTADNTTSIIDCAVNKVIATIPVGKNPKRLVVAK